MESLAVGEFAAYLFYNEYHLALHISLSGAVSMQGKDNVCGEGL